MMRFPQRSVFYSLAIIITGLCLYANSWKGDFIWDDEAVVRDNVYLKSPAQFKNLITQDVGAGSNVRYNFYRPLHMATFFVNYYLSGLNTSSYHITNTVFHIITALLFCWLIVVVTGSAGCGFLAGLLFIAHPANIEAVTYISGRADILSALFMLLSFILYIKQIEKRNILLFVGMLSAYLAAFLSKENAIVFPLLLLLYHFSFSKKIRFKIFLPVLVLCVFMVGIRQMAIKQIFFNLFYSGVLFRRVPGFFDAIWNYSGILLLPMGLHMERGNRFFVFTDPGVVLGITVTIILLAGSFIIRKRGSLIFFFTWWFFIAFIPSTSIFPVLAFYMAEHWLYFPALGFFALLAMGLNSFYTKNRAAAAIISAALLLFYSISTIAQNRVWKDKIVFYEYCLKFSPESGSILSNLGTAYLEAGRYADAVKFCSQAVAVNPDFAVYRCNLGRAYLKTGDRDKAKREFEQAIMFGPYCEYPHLCMGEYYMAIGKAQEAIAAFEYAVKLSPNYIQGYLKLSEAYAALSNYEEAGKARKKALQLGGRKI